MNVNTASHGWLDKVLISQPVMEKVFLGFRCEEVDD